MNFTTSCAIWYSPQSIFRRFFSLPWSTSAKASTVLVLPVPVGPSKIKTPAGRLGTPSRPGTFRRRKQ